MKNDEVSSLIINVKANKINFRILGIDDIYVAYMLLIYTYIKLKTCAENFKLSNINNLKCMPNFKD